MHTLTRWVAGWASGWASRWVTTSGARFVATARLLLLLLLLLIASLALPAAIKPTYAAELPLSKVFADQPAGEYTLDRAHASVVWRVAHMGLSRYTARFDKMDGKLDFRPGSAASSSVEFTIETPSVNTGLAPFNRQLMGADWFDGVKHPIIRFRSTKMEATGGNMYRLTGDLTLRGTTKPVVWNVTFNGGLYNSLMQGHAVGFSARTTLKRSEWGMTKLVPMVADEVEVEVEVEFVNQNKPVG
jgi:polyisoprenoid-binding protein YceI